VNWDWRIFARVCAGIAVANAVYHEGPTVSLPEIPMPFASEYQELDAEIAEADRRLQALDDDLFRMKLFDAEFRAALEGK